ncbi:hypothetical protein JXA88_00985 [Candidatus Fermentibacteria bacterium]|nr:hypothetical protein [Candidatus Fermentibacteria bacterium]
MSATIFPCKSCGARLEFAPGAGVLKCPYCGADNQIPESAEEIFELDFHAYLAEASASEETMEATTATCTACGATSTVESHTTLSHCPFCGTQFMVKAQPHRFLKPRALLPFKVTQNEAWGRFRAWLKKLWFAPGTLKSFARASDSLKGMYIPYWTYDTNTTSQYTGERGDNYTVSETYQTKDTQGRLITRTRQVVKIRWRPASGVVRNDFDDVLVLASNSLPRSKTERLEPWDLKSLVPYRDEYLSGFGAEAYQVDLQGGFDLAKGIMDRTIRSSICRDIGGDHQRIHAVKTRYDNITYKHILLPLWISAYRYRNKVYRFIVNGRTGAVQGERPWSKTKIVFFVIAVIAVAVIVFKLLQ